MIKVYRPTTAGRRKTSILKNKDFFKGKPRRNLIEILKKTAGRNRKGQLVVRHQGGGEKNFYRKIDFKQNKFDIPAKVETIEYDPNRSCSIALLCYADGERRYIIAPEGLKVGDKIISSKNKIDLTIGSRAPLKYIPLGSSIYNVEMVPGMGGKIARSAGNCVVLMAIDNGFAQIKMPSSERRIIREDCLASFGQVGNVEWRYVRWGLAGRTRHRGIRPSVKGKVMAPVAHPHGGGEGHSPIGLVHPKTPWGKPALGVKTRNKKKWTKKYIIQRREKKKKNK